MMTFIAIFIGGGLGSCCRYGVSQLAKMSGWDQLPLGTITSNILASLLLGYLSANALESLSPAARTGLMVGFCGGFSTFSTFTAENHQYLSSENWWGLAFNLSISVVVCIFAFVLGLRLAS